MKKQEHNTDSLFTRRGALIGLVAYMVVAVIVWLVFC